MTRQEQLRYCKACVNRRFNSKRGIVCSLTDEIAKFDVRCENFLQDINVKLQEPVEDKVTIKAKKKKLKKKKVRIPEKLTKNDLYLLIGIALASTFILRLNTYITMTYKSTWTFLLYVIVTLVSISIALFLREKEQKGYRFFGDIKFKLAYTLLLTISQLLYLLITTHQMYLIPRLVLLNLIFVFLLCMLSFLLVKPIYFIYSKFSNRIDEKIS